MDRSYLFVPGDRPDRFEKALASGAHAVIVDLEDAVAPARKAAARAAVREWLDGPRAGPVFIRVNAQGTPWHDDDLQLAAHDRVRGVMLPKAEDASLVHALAGKLGPREFIPLVETVAGWYGALDLAWAPGVTRLAFGNLDFMADSGIRADGDELNAVRIPLVLASRRAGIQPPIEGVTAALGDVQVLESDLARARRLGFGAKLCIHPSQVGAANAAFLPSENEREWARRVIAALEAGPAGAVSVDGKLVDKPVERQARAIVAESNG